MNKKDLPSLPTECQRCGKCCTSFGVCVTLSDIVRISKATGLKPADFVTVTPEPPERERTEPAVMINGIPSLLILKWKPGKGRVCIFYDQKKGACSIYESRPTLCRTYPFKLGGRSLVNLKSRLCPILWMPKESGKFISDLKSYESQLRQYNKIVKEWNTSSGNKTLDEFLDFAAATFETF